VSANVAWSSLRRESKADAFYAPPLVPVLGTATGKRLIARRQAQIWRGSNCPPDHDCHVHAFCAAGSVRQAGGRSGDFFMAVGQFRF